MLSRTEIRAGKDAKTGGAPQAHHLGTVGRTEQRSGLTIEGEVVAQFGELLAGGSVREGFQGAAGVFGVFPAKLSHRVQRAGLLRFFDAPRDVFRTSLLRLGEQGVADALRV